MAKVASKAGDVAGFGSGACSGTHLDPLLQKENFKNCKGQQHVNILQPVILAGSLSGGRILSTSFVHTGFDHMSGHFTKPKQEILLTASMPMRSRNHNQERQLKSPTTAQTTFLPFAGETCG